MHITDVIRQHLGWCPGALPAPRFRMPVTGNPVSSLTSGRSGYTMQGVVLDYGTTGISIRLFTVILAGTITGLFAIMRSGLFGIWSSLGISAISILILGVAARMFYQDIRKATVRFTPGAITVRRLLFLPVIIPKDTITAIEVRKNFHHTHRWLFRGAMVIVLVSVIPFILSSGQSQYISGLISRISFTVFIGYQLAIVVFVGLMFYHEYIRSGYSHILAICTNNKKIIGLYVDDPEKNSVTLSKWRMGAV